MRRFLAALAFIVALPAFAQQPPLKLEPLPEPPPPAVGFDPSTDQGVTIAQPEGRVEEILTPDGFKVIRVTTPEGLEYVLQEDQGDASFARQTTGDSGVRVPQWVIFRF